MILPWATLNRQRAALNVPLYRTLPPQDTDPVRPAPLKARSYDVTGPVMSLAKQGGLHKLQRRCGCDRKHRFGKGRRLLGDAVGTLARVVLRGLDLHSTLAAQMLTKLRTVCASLWWP